MRVENTKKIWMTAAILMIFWDFSGPYPASHRSGYSGLMRRMIPKVALTI